MCTCTCTKMIIDNNNNPHRIVIKNDLYMK